LHWLAELQRAGVGGDDVGGQPDGGVFVDGDEAHDVGRREARDPRLLVGGEADERAAAGHGSHVEVGRTAVPANRLGRMLQSAAVVAALETQHAVGAAGPEELVLEGEQGQRSGYGDGGSSLVP
jgi:hypothetical protein